MFYETVPRNICSYVHVVHSHFRQAFDMFDKQLSMQTVARCFSCVNVC